MGCSYFIEISIKSYSHVVGLGLFDVNEDRVRQNTEI